MRPLSFRPLSLITLVIVYGKFDELCYIRGIIAKITYGVEHFILISLFPPCTENTVVFQYESISMEFDAVHRGDS